MGRETQTLYDDFGQTIESRSQAVTEHGDIVWKVTRTAYDSFGRVSFTTDRFQLPGDTPLGEGTSSPVSTSHTIYDSLGRVTGTQRVSNSRVAIVGGKTVLVEAGELLTQSQTIFDGSGRVARTISASGEITNFLYDSRGRQIASIGHPLAAESVGLGTRYPGKMVRLRSELEFDRYGQQSVQRNGVIQVEETDGTFVEVNYDDARETSFQYDSLGRLTRTQFADGTSKSTEYDTQGRVVAEVDQMGLVRRFGYNAQGQLTSVTLPETFDPLTGDRVAPTYEYEYDAQGSQTLIRDPLGRETRFTYDTSGVQRSRILPLGHGADGRLGTTDDAEVPDGGWSERFGYDQRGRRSYQVSFEGVVTQTVYDDTRAATGDSPETSETLPTGRVSQKRFFDSWESFVAAPDAPDEVWEFTYDARGREIQVDQIEHRGERSITRTTTKTYDAAGRLAQHATPEGTLNYTYNVLGQKTATLVGDPLNPIRSTEYSYDVLGRLETVTERTFGNGTTDSVATHRYFYDLQGKLDAELAANGLFKDYIYNAANQLEHLVHYRTDGSNSDIEDLSDNLKVAQFDYSIRVDGRKESVIETWWHDTDGDGHAERSSASYSYTYDELGRLTDEVFDHWDDELDYHDTYVMDLVGNRLSHHRDIGADGTEDQVTSYTYDANDRMIDEIRRDAVGEIESQVQYSYHQTQSSGRTIADGDGTVQQTHRYQYDLQGRLLSAAVMDNAGPASSMSRTTYQYDHTGIRVSALLEIDAALDGIFESQTRTDYLVDHANFTGYKQVVREADYDSVTGELNKIVDYTYGNDELTQTATRYRGEGPVTAETHTFLHDAHASVRALLDATATPAVAESQPQIYFYDAYGNLQGTAATAPQTNLLYSGERFDAQTEQQYLRARYYNPSIGRFNRLDPFAGNPQQPQSYHKYAYTHNDPIQGTDPTGMTPLGGSFVVTTTASEMRALDVAEVLALRATLGMLRFTIKLAFAQTILQVESIAQHVVPLPRQKVLRDYEYALLANASYETATVTSPPGWREVRPLRSSESGFHARLYERNGELVLAYAGTLTASDIKNNFQQAVYGDAAQYQQAIDIVPELESQFGRIDRFVGHSLGGGLASAAAIVYGRPATTFNSAGVHPSFVSDYGSTLASAEQLIDAYRVRGEFLSTLQDSSFLWVGGITSPFIGVGLVGGAVPDSNGRSLWLEGSSPEPLIRHRMGEVLAGMRKMM